MNLDPQTQTHKITRAHQTTTHDHRRSTIIDRAHSSANHIGEAQREKREERSEREKRDRREIVVEVNKK